MTPIPITDRLPPFNQRVLVYDTDAYGWLFGYYRDPDIYKEEWFVEVTPTWFVPNVTHWMPLPPNPNDPH